jgi:hypothetical protein
VYGAGPPALPLPGTAYGVRIVLPLAIEIALF